MQQLKKSTQLQTKLCLSVIIALGRQTGRQRHLNFLASFGYGDMKK